MWKSLAGQWCLGSDEMGLFCKETDYFTLISAPFTSKHQRASHLPFMGEKGMDYLVESACSFGMGIPALSFYKNYFGIAVYFS